jgi:aconitate decarboxylase
MNVAYRVAVALLDGNVLIDQYAPGRLGGDDVWNLIERTEVHHQPAYDRLPVEDRLTTQVRLTLADGTTHAATVAHPRGTGDRALTNDQIRDKYRELTSGTIPPDRQAAIETAVLNVDSLDDISSLVRLLTPVVRSPLY